MRVRVYLCQFEHVCVCVPTRGHHPRVWNAAGMVSILFWKCDGVVVGALLFHVPQERANKGQMTA